MSPTWNWLLLLLKLISLIGTASSLSCYACTDQQCRDENKPFHPIQCKDDPEAACLIIVGMFHKGPDTTGPVIPRAVFRSCAHPKFLEKLGTGVEHCVKGISASEITVAHDWVKRAPEDKRLGGEEEDFNLVVSLKYEVCACKGFDTCNERVGEEGKKKLVVRRATDEDEDEDKPKDEGKKGGGGAAFHFRSSWALGGVIILSFWRAVCIHLDGF